MAPKYDEIKGETMRKKDLALSALILSQALTQITGPVQAHKVNGDRPITLESEVAINGNYKLVLELEPSDEDESYELLGSAYLVSQQDRRKTLVTGFEDGDGNMIFQRESAQDKQKSYVGLYCSSSFTDCTEFAQGERFKLVYDEKNDAWHVSIRAIFTLHEHKISLNVEELSLKKSSK